MIQAFTPTSTTSVSICLTWFEPSSLPPQSPHNKFLEQVEQTSKPSVNISVNSLASALIHQSSNKTISSSAKSTWTLIVLEVCISQILSEY